MRLSIRCLLTAVSIITAVGSAAAQSTSGTDTSSSGAAKFVWGDHPSLRSRDFRIDFRARFQVDRTWSPAAETDTDDRLDLARRRIGLEGRFRNLVDFQVERELSSAAPWRDVFVDLHPTHAVAVQAGKFKVPFSLDENTGATNLDFVYRSMAASQLAPGRSRGVMAHGRIGPVVSYEAGWFAEDGDNVGANDEPATRSRPSIAGRVAVEPFSRRKGKSLADDLRIGFAWVSNDVPAGVSPFHGDTAARLGEFFSGDVWVQGMRRRVGTELRWRPGPFSLRSEVIRLTQERRGESVEDTDLPAMRVDAWYVSGTWAVTGERKARGLDDPSRPLLRGGIGAVELAGRIESLMIGSGAPAGIGSTSPRADIILRNRDLATTFGVNWYPHRWLKVQWNAIGERVADPARAPVSDRGHLWSQVFRLQVTL